MFPTELLSKFLRLKMAQFLVGKTGSDFHRIATHLAIFDIGLRRNRSVQ